MNIDIKIKFLWNILRWRYAFKIIPSLIVVLMLTACATNLQTKVAGNLNQLSKQQTVAILPVQVMEKSQQETASMFRQGLYANLRQSKFNLLERYVVDSLLKQHKLINPAEFIKINPMEFAEILGVDAVLITRINKVERSYMIVHSSIEIGISAQMVDTRTGEILWRAEQTESDFQGIGKIPTGILSAIIGPIQFVTNKLNLHRMTLRLVNKLTAVVKNPEDAEREETFKEPLIASAASRDLKKIENVHNLEAKWAEDVATYTEVPSNVNDKKEDTFSEPQGNSKTYPAQSKIEESRSSHINWTPRNTSLKSTKPELDLMVSTQSTNIAITPVRIESEKSNLPAGAVAKSAKYTIQVGAYKTKTNASQMASNLSNKGYNTFITPYLEDGAMLFKVQVEQFSEKKQASEFANQLTNQENIPTFITIINPS